MTDQEQTTDQGEDNEQPQEEQPLEEQAPELDESRPHFTIGYDANNEENLVIKKGENYEEEIDELEVGRMMTTAQFQNTMGFYNKMLVHREQTEHAMKQMKERKAKQAVENKKNERKPKKLHKKEDSDE